MEPIRRDAVIYSPRDIANGRGEWIGLAEDVPGYFGGDADGYMNGFSLATCRVLLDDPDARVARRDDGEPLTIHHTYSDAVEREIIAPLGAHADTHDVDAIARETIQPVGYGARHGYVCYVLGLRPFDSLIGSFWDVVEKYAE